MKGGSGVTQELHLTPSSNDDILVHQKKELLLKILANELTEDQRSTWLAYYEKGYTVTQIAEARGVNKSTVSRALKRADEKIQRILKYL